MIVPPTAPPPHLSCRDCEEGAGLGFEFSMAFQPIVDVDTRSVFAYEALARGNGDQTAEKVMAKVDASNRYRFDQASRVTAIRLAARLQMRCLLSVNFLPSAVYRPENCIRTTLEAARTWGFPHDQILFEVTEGERVEDPAHLLRIFEEYKRLGFRTAIDDFGAGYSGLNLLAFFRPDIVKLDMALLRGIEADPVRKAIVEGVIGVCRVLRCQVIAEGVETVAEYGVLRRMGVSLFQGFLFARPGYEILPEVAFPD